jgi:hypothetical protein
MTTCCRTASTNRRQCSKGESSRKEVGRLWIAASFVFWPPYRDRRGKRALLMLPTLWLLVAELPEPPEGSAVRVKVLIIRKMAELGLLLSAILCVVPVSSHRFWLWNRARAWAYVESKILRTVPGSASTSPYRTYKIKKACRIPIRIRGILNESRMVRIYRITYEYRLVTSNTILHTSDSS